jgi:protein-S-isoprenylcysteine O-methyltransferase Ste14
MVLRRLLPLLMLLALVAAISAIAGARYSSWPPGYADAMAALALLYAAWVLWEGAVSLRDAREGVARSDRGSNELYALAQGATAMAALLFSDAPQGAAVLAAGAALFAAGLALRVAAVRALGANYSHRVRILVGHELVARGPYRRLRHPAYAGMLLLHLGLCVALSSWVGAACLGALLAPAILWRISIEERALAALPGWTGFARRRARLIPGLW